jgi:hypothetical protein
LSIIFILDEIQEAHAGQLVAILYDNWESGSDFCISGETLTNGSVRYIMPPPPPLTVPAELLSANIRRG